MSFLRLLFVFALTTVALSQGAPQGVTEDKGQDYDDRGCIFCDLLPTFGHLSKFDLRNEEPSIPARNPLATLEQKELPLLSRFLSNNKNEDEVFHSENENVLPNPAKPMTTFFFIFLGNKPKPKPTTTVYYSPKFFKDAEFRTSMLNPESEVDLDEKKESSSSSSQTIPFPFPTFNNPMFPFPSQSPFPSYYRQAAPSPIFRKLFLTKVFSTGKKDNDMDPFSQTLTVLDEKVSDSAADKTAVWNKKDAKPAKKGVEEVKSNSI